MYNCDIMEAVAIPAKFTKKDIALMDEFIKEGYFSTRSDLVRTSVRHFLHELSMREIRSKIPTKKISKKDIESENKEIRKVRQDLWKRKYVKNIH
jgi:Arc/MetJ-type ribon-helix-helix transcriptional regulator